MSEFLKPPHAISIWASKEILYVELPQAHSGSGQSHQLRLPLNVYGLTQVVNILKARNDLSRLGEKGDQTQFQAEEEIKEMSRKAAGYKGKIKKPLAKAKATPELKLSIKDAIRRFINV